MTGEQLVEQEYDDNGLFTTSRNNPPKVMIYKKGHSFSKMDKSLVPILSIIRRSDCRFRLR